MKKMIGVALMLFLVGCTEAQVDKMDSLMRDPHFSQHQQALDDLEHQYLQKKISYSEYQTRKKELEDNYDKEVKIREEKIHE